ncbi:hypothetical protein CARN8_6450001 [mine drainage metagenome]|uniref:Uncharacterized protein n=1 Tax=mine drainage metagenome TaxID=410659 RepID=A0A3P3ZR67_9ZZZZ
MEGEKPGELHHDFVQKHDSEHFNYLNVFAPQVLGYPWFCESRSDRTGARRPRDERILEPLPNPE